MNDQSTEPTEGSNQLADQSIMPSIDPPIMPMIDEPLIDQTEVVNRTLSNLLRAILGKHTRNWPDCLPFVEFAYNRATHSSTKLSPFEIVYGFNPLTPLDLSPLPQEETAHPDGARRADLVKELHRQARENIQKKTEEYARHANKGRTKVVFKPGDWVWLHLRPERFPKERNTKLAPRADGPFKVIERINDNAYRLELPGKYKTSATFNVTDLDRFYAEDEDMLRSTSSQEGGNDEDICSNHEPNVPLLPGRRITRARLKETQDEFNAYVQVLKDPSFDQPISRMTHQSIDAPFDPGISQPIDPSIDRMTERLAKSDHRMLHSFSHSFGFIPLGFPSMVFNEATSRWPSTLDLANPKLSRTRRAIFPTGKEQDQVSHNIHPETWRSSEDPWPLLRTLGLSISGRVYINA